MSIPILKVNRPMNKQEIEEMWNKIERRNKIAQSLQTLAWAFLLLALSTVMCMAVETNIMVYDIETGRNVSADKQYTVTGPIREDGKAFFNSIEQRWCGLLMTTNEHAWNKDRWPNISNLTHKVIFDLMDDYEVSIRTTPEWTEFTAALSNAVDTLNQYSITDLTNKIDQVTDAKTRAMGNSIKNCIKQDNDSMQALLVVLKKWKVVAGKNLKITK